MTEWRAPFFFHGPRDTSFRSTFHDSAQERASFPCAFCEAALGYTVRDETEAASCWINLFERHRTLIHAWSRSDTKVDAGTARSLLLS